MTLPIWPNSCPERSGGKIRSILTVPSTKYVPNRNSELIYELLISKLIYMQGSKLTGAQGPLAPGFSKWPPVFRGWGPKGPPHFLNFLHINNHVRDPWLWSGPLCFKAWGPEGSPRKILSFEPCICIYIWNGGSWALLKKTHTTNMTKLSLVRFLFLNLIGRFRNTGY